MTDGTRLSLIVIGRNSLSALTSIYNHDYISTLKQVVDEFIYVDSDSGDTSAAFMDSLGFRVCQLGGGGVLSAAAGRWLGTLRANGDWILFLDSDMQLEAPERLADMVTRTSASKFAGMVGTVTDVLPNGQRRTRLRQSSGNGEARSFGGFLLVKRSAVLEAGNWNPSLFANEELELNSRMRKIGHRIRYCDELHVLHMTGDEATVLHQLYAVYLPWFAPVRYGALGRALAAALRAGNAIHLIRLMPEPFLLLGFLIAVLLRADVVVCSALFILYEWAVISRRSWKFNAVIPGILFSMPYGLLTYRDRMVEVE